MSGGSGRAQSSGRAQTAAVDRYQDPGYKGADERVRARAPVLVVEASPRKRAINGPGESALPELKVGLARADITPPVGVELCGFGPYIGRESTEVLERLYASAAVFEMDGRRAALIACDLVGVDRAITAEVRARVQKVAGLAPESVMVCCTHTHSGPATANYIGWGERDEPYCARLPGLIAASVRKASRRLAPAELWWGECGLDDISYNRVRRDGEIDTRVAVVGVRGAGKRTGRWRGLIAHYSCHPVVMCEQTTLISGDFPGVALNALTRKLGLEAGLFLQGALGDINTASCHKPQEEAVGDLRRTAAHFGEAVEEALAAAARVRVERLAWSLRSITLPQVKPDHAAVLRTWIDAGRMRTRGDLGGYAARYQRFAEKSCDAILKKLESGVAAGVETEIQALRIGDLLVLAQPSELFFCFYRRLREWLAESAGPAPPKLILAGLANDNVGYVPSPPSFDLANRRYSYAAYFVPRILGRYRFAENVGEALLEELKALAGSV